MGLIFSDITDDQANAMSSAAVGWTWHYRFAKAKWFAYAVMSTSAGVCITALVDYAVFKFTGYSGLIGLFLG